MDNALEHEQGSAPPRPGKRPEPPHLTTLVSISCGMPAETFFSLCGNAGVTTIVDMRINRTYSRAFWTHERDMSYICGLHNMRYLPVEHLMPTVEMRTQLHSVIDDKKADRIACAEAWTSYLEQMPKLLSQRQYLNRNTPTFDLLYGSDKTIAFACTCHHHSDCHRSAVLGHMVNWVAGLKIQELYPGAKPPGREPNKVIIRDIPSAGIAKDDEKRIKRLLGGAR